MTDAISQGRAHLQAWQDSRPDDFFSADFNLIEVLRQRLGEAIFDELEPRWLTFGAQCAGPIDQALARLERRKAWPVLRRYDEIGNKIEAVDFDETIFEIGRMVHATRVLADYEAPGREAAQLITQYLLCQGGEAGHACPLACAAGLIKLVQQEGSKELKERVLPLFFDVRRGGRASQFLTEVQGGSDVGANATRALMQPDGSARISGEKWFCSVVDADAFLVTARPEGAASGTAGLSPFLIPRHKDNGEVNGFSIRRLKDKLGTRLMASGEIDFENAQAWPIGPIEKGFKGIIEVVLTTSRVYNAFACAGLMRRAQLEAMSFAQARRAFGKRICEFPLVQRSLAWIKTETCAALSSSMSIAAMGDRRVLSGLSEPEQQAERVLIIMNKMLTALRATQVIHESMEVMAGNGAIEEFSVLPRLYRDAYVLEAWEGTHNVLSAQLLRDFLKYETWRGWESWARERLGEASDELGQRLATALDEELLPSLRESLQAAVADNGAGTLMIRDWAERAMIFSQALTLREESLWVQSQKIDSEKPLIAEHFAAWHGLGQKAGRGHDAKSRERAKRLALGH